MRLDHLRALEAESIAILREVVAEFERPVMLYSIGKASSVLLRLAQKAFHPGPIPFPLLHVDTTYKFREMIEFRDQYVAQIGARLIVHTNAEAIADGTQPFLVGTKACCGALKTKSLLDALQAGAIDAAVGGARGAAGRRQWTVGSQARAARVVAVAEQPHPPGREHPRVSAVELDGDRRVELHRDREDPRRAALLRERARSRGAGEFAHHARTVVRSAPAGRAPRAHHVPDAFARLLAVYRSHPLDGRHGAQDHRGADRHEALGAPAPHHRPRSGRVDGAEEARRLLLMAGLLRICTAGSVDDGKSTLIGRLLYDSRSVYEDQVLSVQKASRNRAAGPIDFSLFTDGLRAEREQGITIDVAYRYFATARRKFILADTPGHEQYTRNMATGASTADVAILLVDARNGVRVQSRRHARIARLLGITDFVVAVNKMDLVDFDRGVFETISDDFEEILPNTRVHAIPMSALKGDNVITRSERTPWFDGASLLQFLETVDVDHQMAAKPFRFPVQLVVRPNQDFRGYAGQILSGSIYPGDAGTVLPSGRKARVKRIATWDGDL